jgi:TonB family protein
MKNYVILLSLFCLTAFGQTEVIKIKKEQAVPALFPGGNRAMGSYFRKTIGSQILARLSSSQAVEFKALVEISAAGKITKVDLLKRSGDRVIDSAYVKAVKNMPDWVPARNELGRNCLARQFVVFKIK